ncbi:MAG: hypothetical protein ACXWQ7_12315 [Bdellovibrio sp.]
MSCRTFRQNLFQFSALAMLCAGIILSEQISFAANQCSNIFLSTDISSKLVFEEFANAAETTDLEAASRKLLAMLQDDFVIPDLILFSNNGSGPQFYDGIINCKFPFYSDFSFGTLTKTRQESLGIHLHELTHQIFYETVNALYKSKPEIIWSFFLQYDGRHRDTSLDLIKETEPLSQFKDKSPEEILAYFDSIETTGVAYNEFFADLIPAFLTGDPDIIFNGIYFKEVETKGNADEVAEQKKHNLRRFVNKYDSNIKASETADAHDVFAESRIWIWQHIYEDYYLQRHPEMAKGKILIRVLKTMVNSFVQATDNFQKHDQPLTTTYLNKILIESLENEFQ